MVKFNLEEFVLDETIKDTAKKLIESESEVYCFNLIKDLSEGQLKKVKGFLSCQVKEISNSLSLLSILVAGLAFSITILEGRILYLFTASITIGIILFIFKDGLNLIKGNNNLNQKIKYLIYIIDTKIDSL